MNPPSTQWHIERREDGAWIVEDTLTFGPFTSSELSEAIVAFYGSASYHGSDIAANPPL